ncbi:hypothetical protein EYF80_061181 [Liparis tanakae]|uniref:Uncharacterized protein n=1 Tax=Liparis tanakae TaxID=230148 RepID=A0A4Z2EK01_9TELE|nr:hypothetical protein EYF80_061181 [Liparis tanakae]
MIVSLTFILRLPVLSQKLRNFHSLSSPGITGEDGGESSQAPPTLGSTDDSTNEPGGPEDVRPWTKEGETAGNVPSDPAIEEADWMPGSTNGKDNEPLWAGLCSMRKDVYQLGGELDIEQIERN